MREALNLSVLSVALTACVTAPAVYLVDRSTVLEEQAGGGLPSVELRLEREANSASPEALSAAELAASGQPTDGDALRGLSERYRDGSSDRARRNGLLLRRCLVEALDGSLRADREACPDAFDDASVAALLVRLNRERRQLWRYLERLRPEGSEGALRQSWRERRLERLICGGSFDSSSGVVVKRCP